LYEPLLAVWSCSPCQRTAAFLNPIEMLWRHVRREVTHGAFSETKQILVEAAQKCFDRFHKHLQNMLSVIGSKAKMMS
jgi:hypothetical protein